MTRTSLRLINSRRVVCIARAGHVYAICTLFIHSRIQIKRLSARDSDFVGRFPSREGTIHYDNWRWAVQGEHAGGVQFHSYGILRHWISLSPRHQTWYTVIPGRILHDAMWLAALRCTLHVQCPWSTLQHLSFFQNCTSNHWVHRGEIF